MQLERGRALTMRPGVSWSGSQQLVRRGAGFSARQRTGRPWVPLLVLISLRVFVVCSSVLCGTRICPARRWLLVATPRNSPRGLAGGCRKRCSVWIKRVCRVYAATPHRWSLLRTASAGAQSTYGGSGRRREGVLRCGICCHGNGLKIVCVFYRRGVYEVLRREADRGPCTVAPHCALPPKNRPAS